MTTDRAILCTAIITMSQLCFCGQSAESISLEEKIHEMLPTPEEERWLQVPWRTDLAKARLESQTTGKPMFLWIMDGHPLGVT